LPKVKTPSTIEDFDYEYEVSSNFSFKSNPLKIHSGTEANQAINIYIEDMHTKALGTGKLINSDGTFIYAEDKDRYIALGLDSDSNYQTDLQAQWLATVTAAQNTTLDEVSVVTKHDANIAVRVLDGAIDYALNQSVYVGAYLQRLEYTNVNVTTMNENIQAAESKMRDTDIAKTFTAFTKHNILTQATQSMLAQANQSSSSILTLLQ